jgi:hypothetical protein
VLEFGTVEGPQANDKAEWIYDAFSAIRSGRYPRISAVSYWHESWSNDDGSVSNLRIDSSTQSLAAYRTAVADPFFIAEIDGEYQR